MRLSTQSTDPLFLPSPSPAQARNALAQMEQDVRDTAAVRRRAAFYSNGLLINLSVLRQPTNPLSLPNPGRVAGPINELPVRGARDLHRRERKARRAQITKVSTCWALNGFSLPSYLAVP